MAWFTSKKEILEYCGKGSKDTRWLDRAIRDWRVIKFEWAYSTALDYIKELEDSEAESVQIIIGLKKEIEELKKSDSKQIIAVPESEWNRIASEDAKDLRNHLSYVWQRNEHRKMCIDKMVQSFFNKNRQRYDFESATVEFYKLIWFTDDSNENTEREWAISEWLLPF